MSRKQAILAIDQGTTSSRAILFSPEGETLCVQQKELHLMYPQKGWVEQNPEEIWRDTLWATQGCFEYAKANELEIAAVGITNQRETTIVWDRHSGEPVYNAIVWQDRRTAEICTRFKNEGLEAQIQSKTGLLVDPYFSATKIAWILDNVECARAKALSGDLLFGTVDCYLIWKLTGGAVHATDVTNASRTMLYNIVQQKWDDDLLKIFNVPAALLPEVHGNIEGFGKTSARVLGQEIIIGGVAGDQQAALIGQACLKEGMVKATYGTGCFALMNIGGKFKMSKNRLLTTVAYKIGSETTYAIEGSIFVAGAAVQWLRDGADFIEDAAQSEQLALSVEDSNEVYFVPAFAGLGAPYWRPDVRGALLGLTRETTKAHIVRAALEAQAYQTLDLMAAMEADTGYAPHVLRVDGGLVANGFVCQFLADMLQTGVDVPRISESTAWGAACLAALHAGLFKDVSEIAARWTLHKNYMPHMDNKKRGLLYAGWGRAVKMLLQ